MKTKPRVCVLQFIELYFCLEATFDIHFFQHKANLFVLAISVVSLVCYREPGMGGKVIFRRRGNYGGGSSYTGGPSPSGPSGPSYSGASQNYGIHGPGHLTTSVVIFGIH